MKTNPLLYLLFLASPLLASEPVYDPTTAPPRETKAEMVARLKSEAEASRSAIAEKEKALFTQQQRSWAPAPPQVNPLTLLAGLMIKGKFIMIPKGALLCLKKTKPPLLFPWNQVRGSWTNSRDFEPFLASAGIALVPVTFKDTQWRVDLKSHSEACLLLVQPSGDSWSPLGNVSWSDDRYEQVPWP